MATLNVLPRILNAASLDQKSAIQRDVDVIIVIFSETVLRARRFAPCAGTSVQSLAARGECAVLRDGSARSRHWRQRASCCRRSLRKP